MVVDFRSLFPTSFDFKQIDVILMMVRERMEVDAYSRIEEKMETYFNYSKPIQEELAKYAEKKSSNKEKQKFLKKIHHICHNDLQCPIDLKNYDINDDNEGMAKWLAMQLGLQMMWTQVNRGFQDKTQTSGGVINPIKQPHEAFKKVFKFFFEERMWHLVKVQYDQQCFSMFNFNQIVKKTLLDKMLKMHKEGLTQPLLEKQDSQLDYI